MRIAIIEDEILIAEDLKQTIESIDDSYQVEAILSSIGTALKHFEQNEFPDLFFSDIQLTDGLSFEFFKETDVVVPVIFLTAFDKYALEAFKSNGVDYLLKPFSTEDIEQALDKFQSLKQHKQAQVPLNFESILAQYEQNKASDAALLVNKRDKIMALRYDEIDFIYLEQKATFVLSKGQEFRINKSLEQLESELGKSFFRVNRQMLIHRNGIQDVSRYFARKLKINPSFSFSDPIVISKNTVSEFLAWWQNR